MVNFTHLALLATAVISASAVDIKFRRFSKGHCQETYHIRKDTNLHDPHCKSFTDDEPPFNSFIVEADDHMDDLDEKLCYATVYAEAECQGQSAVYHGEF